MTNSNHLNPRINYIFIIGKAQKPYISLPRGKGVRLTISQERDKRIQRQNAGKA